MPMRRRTPSRPRPLRAVGFAALAALVLGGCASVGVPTSSTVKLPPVRDSFEVSGRLSARHGSDALAANFEWRHAGERDELQLASPLGQTIAVLSGDASSSRLQAADGRVLTATSWTRLTQDGLGWPLPVEGLKYWIQGTARAGADFSAEADAAGRASVLRQDGWTIVYQAYVQTDDGVSRPSRLTANYPEVELRLAVDRWQ
jgi:outer membrane lipoprotein LolB